MMGSDVRLTTAVALATFIAASSLWAEGGERVLRRTGGGGGDRPVKGGEMRADVTADTLSYEASQLPYFFTIPNEYGDDYYNVRFTPPFAPFWIIGAYVPVFLDIADTVGGPFGTPGLRVVVWRSGLQERRPGYPVEAIDSVSVPFEALEPSSGRDVRYNFIDLRRREINFDDRIDFHIGVTIIADTTTDTLAIFLDDGSRRTDRSGMWSGADEFWLKMQEVPGIELGYNFAIRALVADSSDLPWLPSGIGPDGALLLPSALLLDPAYPNPFNSRSALRYSVPAGLPFSLDLFDPAGRWARRLQTGVGAESEVVTLEAATLPAGSYHIVLRTPSGVRARRVMLLK